MRTDASILAVAAVLFQVVNNPDGTKSYQLIGCASKKFSQQAYSWDIHKKEAYAMYYGYQTFAYYLRGKEFTAQIDHSNLTYIGNNQTPIVVRWRIFMQSFQSKVHRIPGSRMGLADHMSRMYLEDTDETAKEVIEDDIAVITEMALHLFLLNTTTPDTESSPQTSTPNGYASLKDVNDYLRDCHGGRKFHSGVWRT